MPRLNGLTDWQKSVQERERKAKEEASEISRISEAILSKMNAYRGRMNMTKAEFADFVGVSASTYREWNSAGADKSQFTVLVRAAVRCGIQFNII